MAQAASLAPSARRPALAHRTAGRLGAPTLEQVWLGMAVIAAALTAIQPIEPIDYWWSVSLGSLIRQLGAIPADDPLLYTPVRGPMVDGQWLARVILSALHDLGGIDLSLTLRTAVAVATVLLLARACREHGAGPRLTALVAGLSTLLFVPGLAVRPQLLAVIPFSIVARAAHRPPRSIVGVAGITAIVAFWANVHGSFILVYPLLGIGLLEAVVERRQTGRGDRLRQAALLALACGLAPLLNPYGFGLAAYVSDAVLFNGGAIGPGVLGTEWGAPTLKTPYGALFYGSLLLTTVLLAAGRRPRLSEGLLLIAFGLLAVSSVRHVLWWSLVLAPFVARNLTELAARSGPAWLPRPGPLGAGSAVLNLACLALFGVVVVASLPWYRERLPFPADRVARVHPEMPVALADYLAAHPRGGRLFNETDWSAYLSWRLAPDTRVFVDNRFELHPPEVWEAYGTISRGHVSWQRQLDAYGVTRLALSRSDQRGLIEAVRESPDWDLVYEDELALVFDRADRTAASVGNQ